MYDRPVTTYALELFCTLIPYMPNSQRRRSPQRRRASSTSSRSLLNKLPPELLNKVLNHASPESTRRVSQVNKYLRSAAKNRLGLRARAGNTVHLSAFAPPYSFALFKIRENGTIQQLQKNGKGFYYYNGNGYQFYTPFRFNPRKLGLQRTPTKNTLTPGGLREKAYRVQ